ncbi:glycoside hydrolase family 9 protein [Saccharibacillus kuerlensis]|uniref:SLH domain-containing protein n=1 Tax=Saccharibacillus kuerlensis TaxID=459527 RepID=A0ABQ2L2L9_9BACL|nr:glycoside hydrolase family 9 protein [Saccharibacillus kuerlensis]GGO00485.1 hypothetical protein GCM10010969_21760 [Saccharibacillus kuerlensis]
MYQRTKTLGTKRTLFKVVGGLLAVSLAFPAVGPVATIHAEEAIEYAPPGGPDWNKLRDIVIADYGWGDKVTVTDDVYQEQTGKKIETSGNWIAHYTTNGWQTFDFSRYGANGTLEFDAVGIEGGESFRIGFRDGVHERLQANGEFYIDNDNNPEETNIDVFSKDVSEYKPLTTEWQHYSIPLKDLFGSDPLFDPSQVQLLKLAGDSSVTFRIANIKVVSPDTEISAAPIKVNQVGYLNEGEKYALVSGYYNELNATVGTPFEVKRTSDGTTMYNGTLSLIKAYDPSSGEKVLKADFTPLREPGEYEIVVDGIAAPSVPFRLGTDVYGDLLTDVQKFFYYQRANDDLDAEHAGEFAREGLHKIDSNLPLQSNPSITKDVSGGWWDAGDTGKYVTAAATAVSDLLWAYEAYPTAFPDRQLNIPESGNGISDLLDEIKFETDFFLKMQDPETGGFYAYVIREPEPKRFIMDGTGDKSVIPTAQTANTVGALAHASLVFKSDPALEDYSNTLLKSAVDGWTFLENHPEYIAQPDGPYNDNNDKNDRFYAAAALYRATGEAKYGDYVKAHYQNFENVFESTNFSHGINGMEMIGYYHYLSASQVDPEIRDWFAPKYEVWRDKVLDATLNDAVWRNSTQDNFYWGANSNVASVPVSLAIGSRILGTFDEANIQAAASNLNYLLGINPLQLSYITGHGENRIRSTHHEIYMRDFIIEMPNGYMAGGPNSSKAKFPAKAYNESTIDWETNEQALNYNSPLIYLTAMLQEAQLSEPTNPTPTPTNPAPTFPVPSNPAPSAPAPSTPVTPPASNGQPAPSTPAPAPAVPQPAPAPSVFNSRAIDAGRLLQNLQERQGNAGNTAPRVFSDANGHWAARVLNGFAKLGVIEGYADGTVKPNAAVSRAEFAVLLDRLFGLQADTSQSAEFTDINGHWGGNSIRKLASLGILNGYGDGSFKPGKSLSRQEAVVILSRILELQNAAVTTNPPSVTDLDRAGSFAADAINTAAQYGLIKGGTFRPTAEATRAEMLQMLWNALELDPDFKQLLDSL